MLAKGSLFLVFLTIILSFAVDPVGGKQKASDFTLVDIDGIPFTLSNCAAKVVLIDFFATWCGPCKAAIPTFRSLYDEYTRDQLEIISISSEGNDTLRIFAQRTDINMTWIVASDPTGDVPYNYLGLDIRIPHMFLVDAEGYIAYDHLGWRGDSDALIIRSRISSLGSVMEDGDSDTEQTGSPYTLIAIIGGAVIVLLVVSIVVARQLRGSAEPPKKRGSHKGKG